MLLELLAIAGLLQGDSVTLSGGVRSPAWAADGRLAISLRGDIWVVDPGRPDGLAYRLTSGPAWDRDPEWTHDGRAVVFASDRAGGLDLWRVDVGPSPPGEPFRLTADPSPAGDPTVSPDGTLIYVSGTGALADLWVRAADGTRRRLTREPGAELEPALSPDGSRVAYVAERSGGRTLRILSLDGTEDRRVDVDGAAYSPDWSPDGRRLVFGTGPRSPGVMVIDVQGGEPVRVSTRHAVAAWSPDGDRIALADAPAGDVGYNGDPDRLGDRSAGDVFREAGGELRLAPVPGAAASDTTVLPLRARVARRAYNADAFDRVWRRMLRLYAAADASARAALQPSPLGRGAVVPPAWRAVRDRYRGRALAAASDHELEAVIHEMVRARPAARAEAAGRAAVSSAHPLATAAGVEILEAGGNVVDAAVAVSFALGVVEPDASGVGGYGEMLVHLAGMAEPVAIEFMTRLPAGVGKSGGEALPPDGPRLANVPGTVAGMELAWRKYGSGRVSWSRLIEPAIRLAEEGFAIDDAFATTLRRERDAFAKYEGSRALFFRDGLPLQPGDTLRNADLAWTLRQIARGGAEAFYRGEPARRLVADLRSAGNPITQDDMARYFAAEREPVRGSYRGHAIYSGPPPVTGGAALVAKLNLLERTEGGRAMTDDAARLHAMIEAWRLQPSTSGRIADPDLWPVDVTPFESKDTAAARWRCFDPARRSACEVQRRRAAGPDTVRGDRGDLRASPGSDPARSTGTTAFAVADVDGNAVSVTQTLGTWGGTFHVTPGLGFLYNDKAGSYRDDPAAFNGRAPFARNTTVIAPTIVFDGTGDRKRPLLAVGAAGNSWITAAVYEIVAGVIDEGLGVQQALELPRFLPGGRAIQIEDGFAPAVLRRLEELGHSFDRISLKGELRMGYASAVLVRGGRAIAGADPRRSGAAGAVRAEISR